MNNKGFSLILVIICMTFIGVLASMILAMSVNNVQMRVVEEEASDNFYSAEEVLDEIRANMEKQANMALGDAYTLFLQKYAVTAPKNREGVFVTSLSAVLNDLFKKDFVDNYDATAFREKYLGVASLHSGISIDKNGKIYGTYDNGNQKLLGEIVVATFANPAGLESVGNNMYAMTQNSGDFDGIGVEIGTTGGKFNTGVLEMSNVDLASEFTEMITTQRGFQANSRIITTSDTLLEELINLKR